MMDLLTTKFVAMVILGLSVFLIGLSTIKFRRVLGLQSSEMKRSQTFINSIMLCFGAGVLLATAMLHILPECREGLEEAQEKLGVEWLAEVIFCAGFFLVYMVEEIVHLTLHKTPHREQIHTTLSLREPADKTDSACNIVEECCESGCSNDMEIKKEDTAPQNTPSTSHGHSHLPTGSSSPMRDLFTVLALSFHCIFEGLAVGLEQNSKDVWALFTAISVHKSVITFCVSLQLLETGPTMLVFFSYLITFSLVTPLGMGMGMLIGTGDELTSATLQALAGGTLLYVVMFEVLQREKEKEVTGIFQFIGIILGFCFMVMMELLASEPEEPEESFDGGQNATLLLRLSVEKLQSVYSS